MKQKLQQRIVWIAMCLPPILLLILINKYAVNIPFRDSLPYTFLTMQKAFLSHSLTWQDFFIPNNEHILTIPLVIMTFLAPLTHWNARVELFLIGIVAIINVILIILLWDKTVKKQRNAISMLPLILASSLICSIAQWESFTLTLSVSYFLSMTFFLCAVLLIAHFRMSCGRISAIITLCFLSSFSLSNGMLSWLAVLPLIWLKEYHISPKADRNMRYSTTSLFIACFLFTVYAHQKAFASISAAHERYTYILREPLDTLLFFFTLVGTPIMPNPAMQTMTLVIGVLILLLCSVCIWHIITSRNHTQLTEGLPWICILLFALGSGLLIVLGRAQYGVIGAFVPRYITTMLYIPLATLVLLSICLTRQRWIIAILVIAYIAGNQVRLIPNIRNWASLSMQQHHALACLQTYSIASDGCLDWLYPWDIPMDHLPRVAAPLLQEMGFLDVFSIPPEAKFIDTPDHTYGALETIGGKPLLSELSGTGTIVSGWAILDDCKTPDHVILTSGKNHTMIAHTRAHLQRPDMTAKFGNCHGSAGWEVELLPDTATKGIVAWAFDPVTLHFYRLEDTSPQ